MAMTATTAKALALVLLPVFVFGGVCKVDEDCSLNGICTDAKCVCTAAWSGDDCGVLALLPSSRVPAYPPPALAGNTSAWGGGVLRVSKGGVLEDYEYHMYVAEMANQCGLNSWTQNSFIRHAVSSSPLGPFDAREVTVGHWAHNPTPVYDPVSKKYIVYHIGDGNGGNERTGCTGGVTPALVTEGEGGYVARVKAPAAAPTSGSPIMGTPLMTSSDSPNGPWTPFRPSADTETAFRTRESTQGRPLKWDPTCVDNPAPWVFPNGSVMLLARSWDDHSPTFNNRTLIGWSFADTWTGPYTHSAQPILLNGNEDPYLYVDNRGHFHAILHGENPLDAVKHAGRHAFSRTGLPGDWTLSATPAYGSVIHYDDGTNKTMYRRERPHLLLGVDGEPELLYTSVQESSASDKVYTHVHKIRTAASMNR